MLIDTSGFFTLQDKSAKNHKLAIELYTDSRVRLTTNYVLAEYLPLALIRKLSRKKAVAFSNEILNDSSIEIIWVDEQTHLKAVELIMKRPDKNYSVCDAVSFILMREREIGESLTTDRHFEQEGFVRLLK